MKSFRFFVVFLLKSCYLKVDASNSKVCCKIFRLLSVGSMFSVLLSDMQITD